MDMDLPIIYLNAVDSTNTYLDGLAKKGYPHGTVVVADTQTAGRGRFGRVWFSPPKRNIYMSILVRPSRGRVDLSDYAILPMLAGIACARAINKALSLKTGESPLRVTLKWPNDILLKEKKLGGILVDSRIENIRSGNTYFIVGIGINVNMTLEEMPEDIKDIATSLYIATGMEFSKNEVIEEILKEFSKIYEEFLNNGKAYIVSEWQSRSSTIGRSVRALLSDGTEIYGKAIAVDENGYLLIAMYDGGIELIKAGDIYHVDSH